MEAKIIDVKETWPLKLKLKTSTGELNVSLAENANVRRGGNPVSPGELKPGQRVRVLHQETNGAISEIEIGEPSDKLHTSVSSEDAIEIGKPSDKLHTSVSSEDAFEIGKPSDKLDTSVSSEDA